MIATLFAIIFLIVKFMNSDLDYDYDEAEGLFVTGAVTYGIMWCFFIGFTIASMISPGDCDCGPDSVKAAIFCFDVMMCALALCLEPFIRKIIDKIVKPKKSLRW